MGRRANGNVIRGTYVVFEHCLWKRIGVEAYPVFDNLLVSGIKIGVRTLIIEFSPLGQYWPRSH